MGASALPIGPRRWYHGATPGANTLIDSQTASRREPRAFAVRAVLFALLLLFVARTWADPDLWGHVKFGGDILTAGFDAADPYSFGSDRPWINHEWLAEIVMFLAWEAGGGAGLVAVKTLIVLAVLALVLSAIRRVPMSPTLQVLLLFTAVAGMWARTYVFRPQIFSLVLFASMLWLLLAVERGRRRVLWWLPALFALWVNLHGGWIVGLGALGLWGVLNLTTFRSAVVPPAQVAAVLAASIAATLLNPYGAGMWEFIAGTVRLERTMIADWQPLFGTGPGKVVAWGTAAVLAGTAFAGRQPPIPLAHAMLVVGLGAAALKVSRLDAFFSIAVVMLLAPQVAGFAEGRTRAATPAPGAGRGALLRIAPMVAGTLVAVALFRPQFTCVRLDGPWMPEREAAVFIIDNGLRGRLLTWFDWGQYAIWHFAPGLEVSLDGRRETVYSDEYLARHTELYFEPDSQREFLHGLNADHAWLSKDLPLAAFLEHRGWTRLYTGPESVVLSRRVSGFDPPAPQEGRGCFPGP